MEGEANLFDVEQFVKWKGKDYVSRGLTKVYLPSNLPDVVKGNFFWKLGAFKVIAEQSKIG